VTDEERLDKITIMAKFLDWDITTFQDPCTLHYTGYMIRDKDSRRSAMFTTLDQLEIAIHDYWTNQ